MHSSYVIFVTYKTILFMQKNCANSKGLFKHATQLQVAQPVLGGP